jgi:hypothetical protein
MEIENIMYILFGILSLLVIIRQIFIKKEEKQKMNRCLHKRRIKAGRRVNEFHDLGKEEDRRSLDDRREGDTERRHGRRRALA